MGSLAMGESDRVKYRELFLAQLLRVGGCTITGDCPHLGVHCVSPSGLQSTGWGTCLYSLPGQPGAGVVYPHGPWGKPTAPPGNGAPGLWGHALGSGQLLSAARTGP